MVRRIGNMGRRIFLGSVAVVWLEEHGDGMCNLGFCSDAEVGETGRYNVCFKVL